MAHSPIWLATAIDIVVRAGAIQMAERGEDLEIDKKGPIDLVTRVDLEVERMCRETIAARGVASSWNRFWCRPGAQPRPRTGRPTSPPGARGGVAGDPTSASALEKTPPA